MRYHQVHQEKYAATNFIKRNVWPARVELHLGPPKGTVANVLKVVQHSFLLELVAWRGHVNRTLAFGKKQVLEIVRHASSGEHTHVL